MKKISSRLLAIILCVALCLSVSVCNLGVAADTPEGSVNLVSGLIPITFSGALSYSNLRDGDNNLQLRYFPVSNSYMNGYTPDKTTNKDTWSSYLSKLTDGNDSSDGVGFRYYESAHYGTHWTAVIYDLGDTATVDSFSIKTSGQAASSGQDIHVFISDTYAGLFDDSNKVYQGANAADISIDITDKDGKYFAYYTQDKDFTVYEISVYSKPVVEEIDDSSLIYGSVPVTFSGALSYSNLRDGDNNLQLRYFPVSGSFISGYTPDKTTTKDTWSSYLSKLTDGNDSSDGVGFRYSTSGYYGSHWIAVIYELSDRSTIDSFVIKTSGQAASSGQDVHVFVSDTYAGLFDDANKVYQGANEATISASNINKLGSYFAFYTQDTDFTVYEISVYGEAYVEHDLTEGYSDILSANQAPVQFSAASNMENITNCYSRTLRYFPVSGAWYNGYTPSDTETKDTWLSYATLMTDNDETTGMGLRSQYENDYTAIVYSFSVAKIKGFTIKTAGANSKPIKVYVSKAYDDLFSENSLVYSGTTEDVIKNNSAINASGAYIAFVTQDRDITVNEISVYGVWADLLRDKTPVALYPVYDNTAKYSFAYVELGGTPGNNYRYGFGKPEDPSSACLSEIQKLNDADETTYAVLKNTSRKDENNNDGNANDIALIYKFDDNSNVSNISVSGESTIGGAKFYLSKSYATLFNANNMVGEYAGGGYSVSLDIDADNSSLYAGIIIRIKSDGYKSVSIKNISILGESISKEADYGSTLTAANGPANSNANEATKMFYEYLKYVGNTSNVLLGAHINSESDTLVQASNENNYYDYLARKSGLTPAIYSTRINTQSIESYVECYEQGSIPLIMCLFASKMDVFQNLVDNGDDASINYMIKYLDKTYSPSSSEKTLANQAKADFWNSVKDLGDFLKDLENAGVETYIISPFNEMNMYGFYGNKNHTEIIDRFINVWRQVYDYLVNERELKGILFALRPTGSHAAGTYRANPYRYYPGDNYVDIIAPTVYSSNNTGALDTFEGYSSFVSTGKVIGLSETGPIASSAETATADCNNMLNSLKTTYSAAAFASLWFGYRFDVYQHSNTSVLFDGDYVLTVESMHDYRHFNVPEFVGKAPDDIMKRKTSFISSAVKTVKFDANGDFSLNVAKDISDARMIELDVYVQNSAINTLSLKLSSENGYNTYTFSGIVNGWNHLAVRIDDPTESDGIFNTSNVTDYTLTGTANAKVYIANLYAANYVNGDANRDERVDLRDLIVAKRFASGTSNKGNKLAVSQDGSTVLATDIANLCNKLLEG